MSARPAGLLLEDVADGGISQIQVLGETVTEMN